MRGSSGLALLGASIAVGDAALLGCFKDDRRDRVLTAQTSSASTTPTVCADYCAAETVDYVYYATQYGEECWCAEAGIDYERHGSGSCDYPCSGDSSKPCGGFDAFTLYDYEAVPTPSPTSGDEYMGCFADTRLDRVLSDMVSSSSMTIESCATHCTDLGEPFYGVQYGTECWCGGCDVLVSESRYNRHGDGVCDYECAGDSTTTCGGYDAFDLYHTGVCGMDTPAPIASVQPTSGPSTAPTMGVETPAPTSTEPPLTVEPTLAPFTEFEGVEDIPEDVQEIILADVAGTNGFAGAGTVTFDDSLPETIVTSDSGSIILDGVFTLQDGELLDPTTVLYLYVVSEDFDNSEPRRGLALVDTSTGAFTVEVTDVPVGDSKLVLSFVLEGSSTATDAPLRRGLRSAPKRHRHGRELLESSGSRSVFTVPVSNPNECDNALAIRLEWYDGDSDIDLWVDEPGGEYVYWSDKQGGVGFLDFDNTVGFGPENYVLNPDLTADSPVFGTFTIRVHGFETFDKTVAFSVTIRKEGQVVQTIDGSVSNDQVSPSYTVDLEKRYVLAVGGRNAGGIVGINHYSLSQWEGLFSCVPELNQVNDLEEMDTADFQAKYPTARQIHAVELCRQPNYEAWVLDEVFFDDDPCWDDEGVAMSRLVYSNTADVLMPVHWDLTGDIWSDVETHAGDYEYAEPPIPGTSCESVEDVTVGGFADTRWPLTLYEFGDDVNNSNTFMRWLVGQLGILFREIDVVGLDTYPGRDTPDPTAGDGTPLTSDNYGPVWDAAGTAAPLPTGDTPEC